MCAAEPLSDLPPPFDAASLARLFVAFEPHPKVLLALSGGPDSTALLLLAQRWRALRAQGPALVAASVDHRLRPEARTEAEDAGALCASLGVAHAILDWTGDKPASGLQAHARAARYALLLQHAHDIGATALATAHTLDDQAETVLFRLARGSGLAGLAGIPARRDTQGVAVVRPLLALRKSALVSLCRDMGAAFADDPSNRDPRFTRSRLRALLPALAVEGLDAARLAQLARRAARAEAALEAAAEAAFGALTPAAPANQVGFELPAEALLSLPDEISLRVLGRAIERAGGDGPPELGKLEALYDVLRSAAGGSPGADAFPGRTLAGAVIRLDGRTVRVHQAPSRRGRFV